MATHERCAQRTRVHALPVTAVLSTAAFSIEASTAESGKLERTVGVIVKASDLLSRANAMIKASRPVSKAPIAKRPLAAKKPAARKPAGGKKKPCKIA